MAHLWELIVASAEQDVCLQPTDWILDFFVTGTHGKLIFFFKSAFAKEELQPEKETNFKP